MDIARCFICLEKADVFYSLDYGKPSVGEKIRYCLPLMQLELSGTPVFCNECVISVTHSYSIIKQSVYTHRKINEYLSANKDHNSTTDGLYSYVESTFSQSDLQHYADMVDLKMQIHQLEIKKYNQEVDEYVELKKETEETEVVKDIKNSKHEYLSSLISFNQRQEVDRSGYKHACTMCERKFKKKDHLARHIAVHNAVRNAVCDVCNKQLAGPESLRRHKMIHEEDRPYTCPVCSKGFNCKSNLCRHMIIHSGIKPYNCEVCNKSFSDVSTLRGHLVTHTKQKAHVCHICEESFSKKNTLVRHIITHTKVKPHKCDYCGQTFRDRSMLRAHIDKLHI